MKKNSNKHQDHTTKPATLNSPSSNTQQTKSAPEHARNRGKKIAEKNHDTAQSQRSTCDGEGWEKNGKKIVTLLSFGGGGVPDSHPPLLRDLCEQKSSKKWSEEGGLGGVRFKTRRGIEEYYDPATTFFIITLIIIQFFIILAYLVFKNIN